MLNLVDAEKMAIEKKPKAKHKFIKKASVEKKTKKGKTAADRITSMYGGKKNV